MQKTKKGGRFAGCLLASDIDGTLVSAGRIPERNVEAIRRFTQEGGLFALATGRSIQSARRYAALAGVNCPSIVFNGAIGYDFAADKPLWRESLPDGAKGIIPPIMERFPDIGVEVHSGKNLYVLNHTPDVDAHVVYEEIEIIDADFAQVEKEDWTKVLFAMGRPGRLAELHAYCEPMHLTGCYFLKTADCYYELTCEGVSKGAALKRLAGLLGIAPARTFAIGDYYNDVELIQAAGYSCFVETAPAKLHKLADCTACSCEKGAVADFIDKLSQTI